MRRDEHSSRRMLRRRNECCYGYGSRASNRCTRGANERRTSGFVEPVRAAGRKCGAKFVHAPRGEENPYTAWRETDSARAVVIQVTKNIREFVQRGSNSSFLLLRCNDLSQIRG